MNSPKKKGLKKLIDDKTFKKFMTIKVEKITKALNRMEKTRDRLKEIASADNPEVAKAYFENEMLALIAEAEKLIYN